MEASGPGLRRVSRVYHILIEVLTDLQRPLLPHQGSMLALLFYEGLGVRDRRMKVYYRQSSLRVHRLEWQRSGLWIGSR